MAVLGLGWLVVAINKVDKENADVQRVLAQLAEQQLVPESWGGDTICVEMSAQQNLGVDDLIEQLTIVAEIEELTANPTGRAKGVVLELINEGVDSNQLTSKGYGLSKPLESNQTEQGRARNRRTEVLIL